MTSRIDLGDLVIAVTRKDIKHVHLNVHPPAGRVSMAAPRHLSDEALRAFAIGKLGWIRQQRRRFVAQSREPTREYLDRETHYVWGQRCLLQILDSASSPEVEWRGTRLVLHIRLGSQPGKRKEVLERWYRDQVREEVERLRVSWERRLRVRASGLGVRAMRTRWGSCNPDTGFIRLNTDLARKPRECLEYILVHELLHLRVPLHDATFKTLLDQYMPGWMHRRDLLNRLPLRHEDWSY